MVVALYASVNGVEMVVLVVAAPNNMIEGNKLLMVWFLSNICPGSESRAKK